MELAHTLPSGMAASGVPRRLASPRAAGLSGSAVPLHAKWGTPGYPARLAARMGADAPPWAYILGDPARIDRPQVAVIGSRRTPPALAAGARRLARSLSDAGWVITSGLADGADAAAHRGGAEGAAGTLALPPYGLLCPRLALSFARPAAVSCLSAAPPDLGFRPWYAVQRNSMVGALADALVLISTEWRGGSWYAVRRALETGTPVLTLECGARTPSGNAWLLGRGLARPLSLGAGPAECAEAVSAAVAAKAASRLSPRQPEFLA